MTVAALGYAALAASAVGAGVSAYSAHEQGQAQAAAAAYQAQVAKNNQTIAQQYAANATARGNALAAEKQREVSAKEGMVRAAVGASGLDPNAPGSSALRLQEDTARLGALDVETIRNNAAREAYGYQVQGVSFAAQAGLLESESENAATAGSLGAFSSIVGGASSVSSKWATFQNEGVFGT